MPNKAASRTEYRVNHLSFFYAYWLRSGCAWYSPYHQIAFDLSTFSRKTTAHMMLDSGLVRQATELYAEKPQIFTRSAIGKLEHLRGNRDAAVQNLAAALSVNDPAEQQRAIKLLARLSPTDLISWSHRAGRLQTYHRLKAAIAPDPRASAELADASADAHLLNANRKCSIGDKLQHLNRYWQEMGIQPIKQIHAAGLLDINVLGEAVDNDDQAASRMFASVSVVMTVFNGALYLRSALLSVLHQLDVETEVVVIDDASTDNSWNIICDVERKFPCRIIARRLTHNVGTYTAKNMGLALCSKEFVAFQDADDWSHPERLKRAILWLRRKNDNIAVTSRYVRMDPHGRFSSPWLWPLRQWSPNTLVMRRAPVLEAIGNFDNVRVGADTDYFERIRANFGDRRILFQKEVLLIAMHLPTSLMHSQHTGVNEFGYSEKRIAYRNLSAERLLLSACGGNSRWVK